MAKRNPKPAGGRVEKEERPCCKVESIVSIDERGQMVLPKELRERARIKPGDKLALISWDKGGEICCFYLIKAESLGERVRDFLGPMTV